MLKKMTRGKVSAIVIGFVSAVLVGTIVTSTIVGVNASRANPMPDYITKDTSKALGSDKNPYTILEIVPDHSSATIGYLINGCEPESLLKIGATNRNDPNSAVNIYADAFASATSPSSTVGEYTTHYVFKQDESAISSDPSTFTAIEDNYAGQTSPADTTKAYSQYGYFTKVNGTGFYKYDAVKKAFVPANNGDYTWTSVGEFVYKGYGQGNCTRVIDSRSYSYNEDDDTGAVDSLAYKYDFTPVGDFTFVPNNNYNNENYFDENVSEADISSAAVGTKLYMTRTEDKYYSYKASAITVNDLLLKELIGYTDNYIYNSDKASIGAVPTGGFTEIHDTYRDEHNPGNAYSQFGYFTNVGAGKGSYNFDANKQCFVPVNGGEFTWTCVGEFQHVGAGNIPEGSKPCTRMLDYGQGGVREFSYTSTGSGAVGEKAYKYYYSPTGGFKWVPNNNYNNEDIFRENATAEEIQASSVGTKLYMTRTEDKYYSYQASAINYKTQVVTVTPAQLVVDDGNVSEANKAKNLIDTADAIIIHDCSTGYRIAKALDDPTTPVNDGPKFKNVNNGSKDLTLKTVNYIIERGAGATPAAIMFDEDAIKTANSYGAGNGDCPNLKLLYDVYNNLGAKLAYNWMSGQQYSAKVNAARGQAGYRNFSYDEVDALGKSQFVYNFQGNDDSWLTTGFDYESKISKSNLNEPAFNNVDAGSTMSVAKMFSAINKESNGYNQPRKLRILEIEPNEKYIYNAFNKDAWVKYYLDLFPWFIGTGKDVTANRDMTPDEDNPADITITAMPTYEFIGKNEDVNENYDLILVGNKEQDETNGKYGYNDALPTGMAYTAVGDLITTFGGEEENDDGSEDSNNYKWNYALFQNNIWSTSMNAYSPKDKKWYVYTKPFSRNFVHDFFGEYGDTIWNRGLFGPWWYEDSNLSYFVYGTKHGSDANMIGLRYSGNDFTKKKYEQLLDFAKQGPVIVANELYYDIVGMTDVVSRYKVDENSFVYQLASKNLDDSAVNKYSDGITFNKKFNDVKKEIESDSCSATFTDTLNGKDGLPKEYDENEEINYNQQTDASGNNVLQYHFVLNGSEGATYGVNVYTDSNGNGIFEGCINHEKERTANGDTKEYDTEKSANLIIFDETSKANINDGVLLSGHIYLVTKILPDSELGMVPWKLEIYKHGNESVRYSEVGYTRIRPKSSDDAVTINVLQMNTNANMNNNSTCTVNFADVNTSEGKRFQELINDHTVSDDFKIKISYMSNKDWYSKYHNNKEQWAKDLMEYHMLIIGFQDSAKFTNDEDYLYGFEKFREAGKSIILSHDLVQDTSFGIMSKNSNYDASKVIQSDVRYFLRDISGQMRKYFDATSASNDFSYMDYHSFGREKTFEPSDKFFIYTSVKETFHAPGFDYNYEWFEARDPYNETPIYDKYTYTYGAFDDNNYVTHPLYGYPITTPNSVIRNYYSNHSYKKANMIMDNSIRALLYYNYINYDNNSQKGFLDNLDRLVHNINLSKLSERRKLTWGNEAFLTNTVQEANEGQITKYPFEIPKTIFVADTHAQNYQLDLEYDDEGDVLVWYNLSETGNRNDGRKSAVNSNSISLYGGRNQDSRNNYYIYTKGNVTYTGLGHSKSDDSPMSDNEIKLFVNTMIAAYRSSASDPYIRVTNPDAVNNGKTTTLYVEDRDNAGSDTAITYRIFDDTTNSKIKREYQLIVYEEGQMIDNIYPADLATEYTIPVSYLDVRTNGEMKYTIILNSSYRNEQGDEVLTSDIQTVNVVLMPMFGLR